MLPPPIADILPALRALPAEQKLLVIHALTDAAEAPVVDSHLAWETGKTVFGTYRSGRGDLSQNAKQLVKQRIKARHDQSAT